MRVCDFCGDPDSEVELQQCELCGKWYCPECEPVRDDDEPVNVCEECFVKHA